MRLYVLLALFALVPTLVLASTPSSPRVRTLDPRLKAALADGTGRSATFRHLLDQIERRDVIVYIEIQPQLRGRLNGTMTWVTAATPFRYVRVALNPELTGWSLVAALAHELQHVLEVGNAPSILDEQSLSAHYRDVGVGKHARADQWDTEAAQQIGATVRRELAAGTAADAATLVAYAGTLAREQ